ncbi:MAG: glycosyltransferase [Myxococcota bacterium]
MFVSMALLWCLSLCLMGLKMYAVRRSASSCEEASLRTEGVVRDEREDMETWEGISILKPLKGKDDDLYENLRSFCIQDYPTYEILCATKDPNDPARGVVERIQREFPGCAVRYRVQEPCLSFNPKVANLETLAKHAHYDWVVISDSNVRVGPDYLRDLMSTARAHDAGMVTNRVVGVGEETVSAALENMFLNGIILGGFASSAVYLKHTFVLGKSMMFRLSKFEQLGGFAPLRGVIVEDEVASNWFRDAGEPVVYARQPVYTNNRRWRFGQFLERHIRWARVRLRTATPVYFLEPLASPMGVSWLWLLVSGGTSIWAWWSFALSWGIVWGRDQMHAHWVGRLPYALWTVLLVPLFAMFHFALLLGSPWSNRVSWRGASYRMGWRTEILDGPGSELPLAVVREVSELVEPRGAQVADRVGSPAPSRARRFIGWGERIVYGRSASPDASGKEHGERRAWYTPER